MEALTALFCGQSFCMLWYNAIYPIAHIYDSRALLKCQQPFTKIFRKYYITIICLPHMCVLIYFSHYSPNSP